MTVSRKKNGVGPGFCHIQGKGKFPNSQRVTVSLKYVYIYTHIYIYIHMHKIMAEQTKYSRNVSTVSGSLLLQEALKPFEHSVYAEGSASPLTPIQSAVMWQMKCDVTAQSEGLSVDLLQKVVDIEATM